MNPSHSIRPVFDDPNLVSAAGLVPALRLAESAGLHDLLDAGLSLGSPNAMAMTTSVVGGMRAGADFIDDLDLLRHGGMPRLFAGVRAPSTLGTFLRSFTHGHVQQLDAVGGRLLAGLTRQIRERQSPDTTGQALTLEPGARPLRTQPHVSAAAALWRVTNSAIGSATAAGSVVTEK